ncbi:MAG: hypothetical protein KBT03_09525 [Bacteroidales bacterium]|nr:hypothetical protein [Candidatus Scybalousia scybalohippi]
MAQVAFIKVTSDWETLEDLISEATGETFTFDATKTYQIECRGSSNVYLIEPDFELQDDFSGGVMLDNTGKKLLKYKKGSYDLYVRADLASFLNITVLGE